MNTLHTAQRIETASSHDSVLRAISTSAATSKSAQNSAQNLARKQFANWSKAVVAFGSSLANFAQWIAKASIVRSVAPGARALERHEFESVQARRGGFGNVF